MSDEIRVLLADDHPVVRTGLRKLIEADPRLVVVAEVGDGEEALAAVSRLQPDIAVLDIDMPKRDGVSVLREMKSMKSPSKAIFLTIHGREDMFHAAMDLGLEGYILKESAPLEIVAGLRAVATGQFYVSPPLTQYLLRRHRDTNAFSKSQPGLEDLSPSERRILKMIAEDCSSKEIAVALAGC